MSKDNRRNFLKSVSLAAAAAVSVTSCGIGKTNPSKSQPNNEKQKIKLGLASYTFRKFDLAQTLAMTKRVGLDYIAFKSFHLSLDSSPEQIKQTAQQMKDAGLNLYGGGVIYMKDKAQVNQAFDYARAAGMKVIIGVPLPELLDLVQQKVRQYDIKVAIHNHGPKDKVYPTPASVYEKIKNLDPRIGICNDIGHTCRAGKDPAQSIIEFADRLFDVHMKDVNQASAAGHATIVGRGIIDIPAVLRALQKIKYNGVVAFEYEPDPEDPLPGLAESVGYVKGVLTAL